MILKYVQKAIHNIYTFTDLQMDLGRVHLIFAGLATLHCETATL